MMTDFQIFFLVRLRSKFLTESSFKIPPPPHIIAVAVLYLVKYRRLFDTLTVDNSRVLSHRVVINWLQSRYTSLLSRLVENKAITANIGGYVSKDSIM